MQTEAPRGTAGTDARFTQTHWSVILAAADPAHPEARQSLETLCAAYWYPLYAFLRRQGRTPHDAQDLTQGFFAHLLQREALASVRRERGKFRTFLLASLKNFAADEWDKAQAQKRGGGAILIPINAGTAEERYAHEPADRLDPEKIFVRRWALTLLDAALNRLRSEYEVNDRKRALFADISPFLQDRKAAESQAEIAKRHGVAENSISGEVSRMRARYRELLRSGIADTVATPEQVDDEMRELLAALRV